MKWIQRLVSILVLVISPAASFGATYCQVHFFNGSGTNMPIWIATAGPGILFLLPPGETVHQVHDFTMAYPGAPTFGVWTYAEAWVGIPPGATNTRLDAWSTNWIIKPVWVSNAIPVTVTNTAPTNAVAVTYSLGEDALAVKWYLAARVGLVLLALIFGGLVFVSYKLGRKP
jgi:hypothetical protein